VTELDILSDLLWALGFIFFVSSIAGLLILGVYFHD